MLEIRPGAAHLWYVFSEPVRDEALLAAYHRLMAPDEAAQQARFLFADNRHEYLLTRALVRTVLSKYADVAPEAWTFVRNEFGRPQIAGPPGGPPLRFNLSNTRGLIACLVALDRDVGVDVEDTERSSSAVDIADRFFSPAEVRALLRVLDAQGVVHQGARDGARDPARPVLVPPGRRTGDRHLVRSAARRRSLGLAIRALPALGAAHDGRRHPHGGRASAVDRAPGDGAAPRRMSSGRGR